MNKKIVIIMLVIMATIGVGLAYLLLSESDNQAKDSMTNSVNQSEQPAAQNPTQTQATPSQPGAYITYAPNSIATTSGTKLLFFHAPWCPQCRDLEADIQAKGVPTGVTIIKVDYDSNQALRQEYGVTIQTTVVKVDDSGKLLKKFVAYDEPTLAAITKNLL